MTIRLTINQVNPEMERINEAAAVIRNGGIVVFPTETVYGIGADAFNADACGRIFRVKERPADNPLMVHISRLSQLDDVASDVTDGFMSAAKILWPGPVTFILKRNKRIPDVVTAKLDTVAVRMPAHPIALRLVDASGTAIAAPSANISKKPSATRAEHVMSDFDGKVDAIIDGGHSAFGLESTIIDMSRERPVLLRPGAFTIEELEKYLGAITIPESIDRESESAIAPGMKYRHYAPDKKLVVVSDNGMLLKLEGVKEKIIVLCSDETADRINGKVRTLRLGSERNLYEIAKNLFDAFRRIDKMDAELAVVQSFPRRGIGLAIMNRILKASDSSEAGSMDELKRYL